MIFVTTSLLLAFGLTFHSVQSYPAKIGALFRKNLDDHLKTSFVYAVEWANKNIFGGKTLSYHIDLVPEHYNLHDASTQVCSMLEKEKAIAIVGPSEHRLGHHLEMLCDQLQVPFLSVTDNFGYKYEKSTENNMTVNFFPSLQLMEAIKDLILYWEWKTLTIVYKEDQRVVRLAKFFEDIDFGNIRFGLIKIENNDYLSAAKRLKMTEECSVQETQHKDSRCEPGGLNRVLLDLSPVDMNNFLIAALKTGLIEVKHWYLMTSTDLRQMDMELFSHNHARFVGLDLVDLAMVDKYDQFLSHVRQSWTKTHPNSVYFPATESILTFDAVTTLALAYKNATDLSSFNPQYSAACSSHEKAPRPHPHGTILLNYLNLVHDAGLSGDLMFYKGDRTNVSFNVYLLGFVGTVDQIGFWESERNEAVNVSLEKDSNAQQRKHLHLTNELKPHFRVTTIEERPYVMLKRNHYKHEGNDKFEGFCIDLLGRLSREIGFTFTVHLVKDGRYGNENENGTWDGMIGEILRNEADMAVAPLTVNYRRAEHVDFTKPFLSLGISILYRIPSDQTPDLFSFLNPLSKEIWLWIVVAAMAVTLGMFVVARLTPYEWNPSYQCCPIHPSQTATQTIVHETVAGREPPVQLTNNYSFFNTLWYVTSTMLKGGCDFGPRAVSTRLLGGVWWVFTLVITSAYTANLAAVLTVDRRFIAIKSLEDLANQTDISYGAISGGSTMQFFQESKIDTHQRMWYYMQHSNHNKTFVKKNSEGVLKVLNGGYAYLMESTSLDYEVQQNCNLTQVGGVLGSKGYGIALRKRSEMTDKISRRILDYAERGIIELDKTKWWRTKGAPCTGKGSALKVHRLSLNMENVSGLFVILFAGVILAAVSVVVEFCIRSKKNAREDKKGLCSEVLQELRFALKLNEPTMSRKSTCSVGLTANDVKELKEKYNGQLANVRRLSADI